ncbi:hypothetical protein EV363DRAFT_1296609 [Boletus edulis]|nr:hypothetical protein EV363DRAFT_1296609 [Boletus edulis]
MTHPPPHSSDSFNGDENGEAPQAAVLQWQRSTSTVPGTPGVDSPNSGGVLSPSNLERGTPMAIGAFKVPSSPRVSHFTMPLLSRTQHPSKLSTSFTFSSPSISLRPGDYIGAKESVTTSDSEDDSERDEACLLLRIVRAQRHARQLEQDVISAQLAKNTAIGDLFKFRVEQVQKKLDATEYDLGYLRNEIRKSGISLADLPSACKRRRLSNENSFKVKYRVYDILISDSVFWTSGHPIGWSILPPMHSPIRVGALLHIQEFTGNPTTHQYWPQQDIPKHEAQVIGTIRWLLDPVKTLCFNPAVHLYPTALIPLRESPSIAPLCCLRSAS